MSTSTLTWHPATEHPDAEMTVLCGFSTGEVAMGYWDGEESWRHAECDAKNEPTCWADLPEVPVIFQPGFVCAKCGKHYSEHTQTSGYRCPGTTGSYKENNWTPPRP